MQTMENKELRAFLIVLRQALLMVTAYIEKNYMTDKSGTTYRMGSSSSMTQIVPTENGYSAIVGK